MKCTHEHPTEVVDSRRTKEGHIRRRRDCTYCGQRFTTLEVIVENAMYGESTYDQLVQQLTAKKLREIADNLGKSS